jgi:Holliday junction DNA helicase RuvA
MYHHIRGTVHRVQPGELIVEAAGIGYRIEISFSVFKELENREGKEAFLYLLPFFREDTQRLFGFLTEKDRELFRLLLSVRGLGPANALSLLSGLSPETLHEAIAGEKKDVLQSVRGIGKRSAERIILELRDKLPAIEVQKEEASDEIETARLALQGLGYSRQEAVNEIGKVVALAPDADPAAWIKMALQSRR